MSENADLVVLNYLARVSDAAHAHLTSDQRVHFVARLRADIEEARRGANSPEKVQSVLDGFGAPEGLVEEERRRLERDGPTPPAPVEPEPAMPALEEFADDATATAPIPAETGPVSTVETAPLPAPAIDPQGGRVEVTAFRRLAHPANPGQPRPRQRRRYTAGVAEPSASPAEDVAGSVVRAHWRALLAVAVCGLGGLLFPALWLVGAGLALWTRAWDRVDQAVGLGLPVLIALGAGIADDYASPGGSLWHALDHTGLLVFRFVSLAGAAYLGWRLFNATGVEQVTESPPPAPPVPWRAGPTRR